MGAAAGGLVGALLAVPLVAALLVILERAQDRETMVTLEGQGAPSSPSEEERDVMGRVSSSQPQPDGEEASGPPTAK